MIKTFALALYQNHDASTLNLHPGVNVIRGESDQGKSAIVRGFSWVILNRPQGTENIQRGIPANELTEATITTSDGVRASRQRDRKHVNQYELVTGENAPEAFKALRTDVPDEIREALRMDALNVQGQHEDYFLLKNTPGEVARHFNKAVGLDAIDESLSKAGSMSVSAKNSVASESARLSEIETALRAFANLDDHLELARKAYELEKESEEIFGRCTVLQRLINDAVEFQRTISRLSVIEGITETMTLLQTIISDIKENERDARHLSADILGATTNDKKFRKLNSIDFSRMEDTLEDSRVLLEDSRSAQFSQTIITTSLSHFRQNHSVAQRLDEEDIPGAINALHAILAPYESCPVCWQPLSRSVRERMAEQL